MSEKIHIGKFIENKLREQERSIGWLARRISCDRSNLRKILQQPFIHSSMIWRISRIMDYDFFKYCSVTLQEERNAQLEVRDE